MSGTLTPAPNVLSLCCASACSLLVLDDPGSDELRASVAFEDG